MWCVRSWMSASPLLYSLFVCHSTSSTNYPRVPFRQLSPFVAPRGRPRRCKLATIVFRRCLYVAAAAPSLLFLCSVIRTQCVVFYTCESTLRRTFSVFTLWSGPTRLSSLVCIHHSYAHLFSLFFVTYSRLRQL